MVHASIYAVLAGLCLRALAGGSWAGVTVRVGVASLLLATAYGATDEFHQLFVPGRTADLLDLCADFTGSSAAAFLVVSGSWLRRRGLASRMENLADGHSPGR
jgi:VanZ family protein